MAVSGKQVFLSTIFALVIASAAHAEQQPLPERLTIEHALSLVEASQHPELERARARIDQAEAEQLAADAQTGLDARIVGRLRYVEPNENSPDQSHDDNAVSLFVSKPLYDFGRSEAQTSAADAQKRASELAYIDAFNARRIEVMQRFFDVIIADHEFLRDNEDMAHRFVRVDKARDRMELGQLAEVEVLRLETIYQERRLNRYRSEARQRSTRANLAIALNKPNDLPGEVVYPELPSLKRDIPDELALQKLALEKNPAVIASRASVQSAQARVDAARASDNAILSAEAEASSFSREIGSRDDARIGLRLEIPLFTGGKNEAAVAKARAELRQARANAVAVEAKVLEAVLAAALDIRTLRAQLQQAEAQRDWSEQNLDLRRSQYELEQQATLGDAMVEIAKSELFTARTQFQLALTWARLDALLGKTVFDHNSSDGKAQTNSKVAP